MGRNSVQWTKKQEELIRMLKNEQKIGKKQRWEEIANKLNLELNVNKTAKQCRQRYINYIKFNEDNPLNREWSEVQTNLFFELYLEKGPSWSQISKSFKTKSQNSLKNRLNNSLKMALKILNQQKVKAYTTFRPIQLNVLSILLRISNEVLQIAKSKGEQINTDSLIFKFRTSIIRLCFRQQLVNQKEILELIRLIGIISKKIKCFKIFKMKFNNQSVVSDKLFQTVLQIKDDIIQKNIKIQEIPSNQIKIEKQQQINYIFFQQININQYVYFYNYLNVNDAIKY